MIRPTRAGIGLGVGIVLLIATGRLLGLLEFYFLGAMVALAVVLAALYVLLNRPKLSVNRVVAPGRPRVANLGRVDLGLTNMARWRTPVLLVRDPIEGHRSTNVMVAPVHSRQTTQLAYRLPTNRRGPVSVGPLQVSITDPLGLFRQIRQAAEQHETVVLPELLSLKPLDPLAGRDNDPDAPARRKLTTAGEEFFALRPYVVGDELKRVDWRATARTDDLVVRQEEQPRTGRLTLVLDHLITSFGGSNNTSENSGFERAVSVAASLIHAGHAAGEVTRFVAGDTTDTAVRTLYDLDRAEDRLARVELGETSEPSAVIQQICRSKPGGTLVVITGAIGSATASALSQAAQVHDQVIAVSCVDGADTPTPDRFPFPTVVYSATTDFGSQWQAALARSSRRHRVT